MWVWCRISLCNLPSRYIETLSATLISGILGGKGNNLIIVPNPTLYLKTKNVLKFKNKGIMYLHHFSFTNKNLTLFK